MKEKKVLILNARAIEPVRKPDGGWTTVLREYKETVEDLGRPYVICNVCGAKRYPECQSICAVDYTKDPVLDCYRSIEYIED